MNTCQVVQDLIDRSQQFKEKMECEDSCYFENLEKGQTPSILWIGCADSRVDPSEILGMPPGNIFVQRNVANQVLACDADAMAVVEYAVIHLKVKTLIVCGHTKCGGINGTAKTYGDLEENLQKHLACLKDEWELLQCESDDCEEDRITQMYGLNAKKQVENLMAFDFVSSAVENGTLNVLPMLFDLGTGLLSLVE